MGRNDHKESAPKAIKGAEMHEKEEKVFSFMTEKGVEPSILEKRKIISLMNRKNLYKTSVTNILKTLHGEGVDCVDRVCGILADDDFLSELEVEEEEKTSVEDSADTALAKEFLPAVSDSVTAAVPKEGGLEEVPVKKVGKEMQDAPDNKSEGGVLNEADGSSAGAMAGEGSAEKEPEPVKVVEKKEKKRRESGDERYAMLLKEFEPDNMVLKGKTTRNLCLYTLEMEILYSLAEKLGPRRGRSGGKELNGISVYSINTVMQAMMKSFIEDMKSKNREDVLSILYEAYDCIKDQGQS